MSIKFFTKLYIFQRSGQHNFYNLFSIASIITSKNFAHTCNTVFGPIPYYTVSTILCIYSTQPLQPLFLPYLHSGPLPPHFMTQWTSPSPSTLHKLSSLSSSLTFRVGPLLLILWHSGPIPRHLMTQWAYTPSFFLHSRHPPCHRLYTNCPASVPLWLTQWAHTSSFYDTVGLYPPFFTQWAPSLPSAIHKLSSLNSSLTYTVSPYLLNLWHSGPIPPILWHSGHHPHYLLYTHCPASVPLWLTQWVHTSSFYDIVCLYHIIFYTVGTLLDIGSTQTVQPQFFPYLHSGPITYHFMTQWAHTSSFNDTVGLYPLKLWHSGHHPRHLLYTNCPASVLPLLTQWAHYLPFYDTVGPYLVI